MNKIKLEITKVDRRKATCYCDPWGCLIATAAKRHFQVRHARASFKKVRVGAFAVIAYEYTKRNDARLMRALTQPIRAFKPFTVVLTPI